jgi:hypothetical protein
MGMVVALDVHRNQITFKALDRGTGEVSRGRIAPAARVDVRAWLGQFAGRQAEFALEGTTGWRFVVEEIERAGHTPRISPIRRRRPPGVGGSGERRPTTPTVICSSGCCWLASCRNRGSRRRTSSSCAPWYVCARR